MKKGLLELIKERLKKDFHADRFDPPAWLGTPASHEPTFIPKRTSARTVPKENPFGITADDFTGYQLKLMAPPFSSNNFEAKTLYLEYKANHLVCTVCDPDRVIAQSYMDVEHLRSLGAKIEIPLRASEMEPIVPFIIVIHKMNTRNREKESLAGKTVDKKQESYLQAYIELAREQLHREQHTMSQLKSYVPLDSDLKQKFDDLEKELIDMLDLTLNSSTTKIVDELLGDKKTKYTQIDINTVGVNILSEKIKDITSKVRGFEGELVTLLKEKQDNAGVAPPQKPPKWTQRADENPKITHDDVTTNLVTRK